MSCIGRAWGDGGFVKCGKPTHPGNNYCRDCCNTQLANLRHKVSRAKTDLAEYEVRIMILEREQQRR